MRPILPLLFAVIAGCHHGTRPATFAPAQEPAGIAVAVRVTGETSDRVGELLAADSNGVIVRAPRVTHIAWQRVHAMDVHKLGAGYDVTPGKPVLAPHIARLAAVSRFPQGLSGDLLRRVLELVDQPNLEGIAEPSVDSLADRAAVESERYSERRAAIADGYRRVGKDFPGMGEHWVNPVVLYSGRIDAMRPTFLTYATIGGQPALMGVGFIATTSSDTADAGVPGWPEHWHEHSGLLSEESGARIGAPRRVSETRVWVLHVWTSLPNPEGRFAADNWALPFARAGVVAPRHAGANAARAFALAFGGDAFVSGLLTDVGLRDARTRFAVDSVIALATARARAVHERLTPGSVVDEADVAELGAAWNAMCATLSTILGPDAAAVLAPPHRAHGASSKSAPHAH